MLTRAFTEALRDHAAAQEQPLAALDAAVRSLSGLLTDGRDQVAARAAPAYDELAIALRMAFAALWVEFGGDRRDFPASGSASR